MWLPVVDILEDGCVKQKNSICRIIKVWPINYDLKSNLEKEAVLNSYKLFLKTCDFDIQLIVQSKKENLSKHILKIQQSLSDETNPNILELSNKYLEYIKEKNIESKSSSKNFYIVIKESLENNISNEEAAIQILNDNTSKIKESLSKVGNHIKPIQEKSEIQEILSSFYNQRLFEKFIKQEGWIQNLEKAVLKQKIR